MEAIASRTFAGVIVNGRPPVRPRARAEARPAIVRSEINSRSKSARAAKIPKTSLPAAVVVSIAAPWPVRTLRPMPRAVRSWTVLTRWCRSRPTRRPRGDQPVKGDALLCGIDRELPVQVGRDTHHELARVGALSDRLRWPLAGRDHVLDHVGHEPLDPGERFCPVAGGP